MDSATKVDVAHTRTQNVIHVKTAEFSNYYRFFSVYINTFFCNLYFKLYL